MNDFKYCPACKTELNKARGVNYNNYYYCPKNDLIPSKMDHYFEINNYFTRLSLRNYLLKQKYDLYLIDDKWYNESQSILIGDINTPIQDLMQNSQILDLFS
jgi:hypothetical protein